MSFQSLRTLRSEGVSAVVGFVEVSHDELRTLVGRHLQHLLNLRHSLHIRQQRLLGIAVPVVGIFALDSHVGARPVDHAHALALTFCGEPYRVAAPVGRVVLVLAQSEGGVGSLVVEHVGDDAVVVGHEASGERVVVGEGRRGKRGLHHSLHAVVSELVEERRVVHLRIVPAATVERDYHNTMFAGKRACQRTK